MEPINAPKKNYNPSGPKDKSNINDPRNFSAKDPSTLSRINSAIKTAPPSHTVGDTPSSSSNAPSTPPKPIPHMPPKVTSTEHMPSPINKVLSVKSYDREGDSTRGTEVNSGKIKILPKNEERSMSIHDKKTVSVAETVAKIMGEALVGNQHKIDANKNGKIDGQDFKILKAKKTMKEDEHLEEGGMPSSVIKHKQSLATKTPEQLHANFKEVAGRMGKSVEHVARSLAWSHGYGKGQGQGSSHYYDKVKHLEPKSESVEQIDEYNSKDGVYKHKGKYGYQGTGAEHGVSDHEKDTDMDDLDYQKKSKKLGARQNMGKRGQSDGTKKKKTNESFTEMLEMYNEHGLKYLAELGRVEEDVLIDETPGQDIQVINADIQNGYAEMTVEEVDNDTFTKEMKDQEAKMNGKKKGGDVAKPSVQAVKQEEVEQIDELSKGTLSQYVKKAHRAGGMADFKQGMQLGAGRKKDREGFAKTSHKREKGINKAVDRLAKEEVQMDERTLTAAEKKEKEMNVKGMKKNLSGFKERYGDKAKSVMYATATKMAKKD